MKFTNHYKIWLLMIYKGRNEKLSALVRKIAQQTEEKAKKKLNVTIKHKN
jgi:hypothetical protein